MKELIDVFRMTEDRVWVRSEYTITGIKFVFIPYGELILVNAPMGI